MKKFSKEIRQWSLLFYLFTSLVVHAQEEANSAEVTSTARVAIRAGFNLATLGGDAKDDHVRLGYHFGVALLKPLNDKFSIQSGLLFSLQGTKGKLTTTDKDDTKYSFSYVNIPLLIQSELAENITLGLGTQLSVRMHGGIKYNGNKEDITGKLNPVDLSLCAALTVRLTDDLHLAANYNLGMVRIAPFYKTDYYNRVFQMGLVYYIAKKSKI